MVKEVKQIKLPSFYFTYEVFLLRITGIKLLERNDGCLYTIYSAFCFLFTLTYLVFECTDLQFHTDFDTISVFSWYIIMDILTLSKVAVLYKNRKEIGDLMRSFHEDVYKPTKIRGGEFEERCIYAILKQTKSQMIPYGIAVVTSEIAALAASLQSRLTKSPENWSLPYSPLSILDTTYSPGFEFAFIYQGVAGILYWSWIYIFDYVVIAIMAQAVAQLNILDNRVRNYKCIDTKIQAGGKEDSISNNLRETIDHHIKLLRTIDKVESLSSYLVLCVFIANTIMLCLTMYRASLVPIVSIVFVQQFAYSALVAAQTLLYCWWGNEMTIAHEKLALEIYKNYNPDDPTPYAKALKLMLVKAQKPLFFTAGKFVPLSLDTFKGLMKGSFSYFTMLRQVNTK